MKSKSSTSAETNRFTVEQANRMLPLVRAITQDIVNQQKIVDDLSSRLSRLGYSAKKNMQNMDAEYTDELKEFRRDLELERLKLDSLRHELIRLGLLPGMSAEYCDFPAMVDGHFADLCWSMVEPEVLFWHKADESCDDRRPLVAVAGTAADNNAIDKSW